jgi:hypothetical protein
VKHIEFFAISFFVFFCLMANKASGQTYVITNPQGFTTGTVQIQGTQGQIVNNAGATVQNFTIYPNQVVTPQGYAIGTPTYTVPPSPPSPPSPRVLQ